MANARRPGAFAGLLLWLHQIVQAMGYSARPISSLHCLPAPLQLRWLLPQTTFEHDELYLCYPRRASLAPKLRAFIDMARNHLNEQCPVQEPLQKATHEGASIHWIPLPKVVLAIHGSSSLRKV
jgi:hypothetical protein